MLNLRNRIRAGRQVDLLLESTTSIRGLLAPENYTLQDEETTSYKVDTKLDWGFSDVSPNGRYLATTGAATGRLISDRATGRAPAKPHGPARKAALGPTFSDSGSMVLHRAVRDARSWSSHALDAERQATDPDRGVNFDPHYSPDGKMIAFTQGSKGNKEDRHPHPSNRQDRYLVATGDYAEVEQWLGNKE